MARVTTQVLAAFTQVVMDTSLCPKKHSTYVLSNGGDLADYLLVFPLYVSHAEAMNPKVCKISHQKKTLVASNFRHCPSINILQLYVI